MTLLSSPARPFSALALIAAWLLVASSASAQTELSPPQPVDGLAQVVEGDRMIVNGQPVRLYGIDAPELGQQCRSARGVPFDCGEAARAVLERMIGSNPVRCSIFSVSSAGDQIGLCQVDGADLGTRMIADGWAFPQRRLSNRYEAMEARAQSARVGLWAGFAERPWLWRRRQGG